MTLRRTRGERGAVAVIVGILASTLFIVAAMVVDLGLARDTSRQSQNAADASALAAGNVLYTTTGTLDFTAAVSAAKAYALENFGVPSSAWTACTDSGALAHQPDGANQCISFDSATAPTKVRVRIPVDTVETGLGKLAGTDDISITRSAAVALKPPGLPCVMCVLGSGQTHNLQNGDVFVDGGNVHFNGSVSVGTNGLVVTNGVTTVEGTASPNPTTNFTPDALINQPPIPDPMAFLTLPPNMSSLTVKTNPCTQGPGKYGSQDLRNITCALTPGLYVIAGSSAVWDLAGNANTHLTGTGVTLYFTCGTPTTPVACTGPGATLDASGNGSIEISGPTSGPLKGATIVFDRGNTSTMRLTGNGITNMSGSIYAATGKIQMNGNGCTATNAAVVVGSIEMNGNPACISVHADPSSNPVPPPTDIYLDQ